MITIQVETVIEAPIEKCFDLARSLSTHVATTGSSRERIVSRHGRDLLELGDEVTFEAFHLGVRQRLASRIVEFERPAFFVDQMLKGAFRFLRHLHEFEEMPEGSTKMVDTLDFESPFGPIGWVVDRIFLRRYMTRFIRRRGNALKKVAEHLKPFRTE